MVGQTHWYLRFQGRLFACGFFAFLTSDSIWNTNFARLDESSQRWEELECINSVQSELTTLVPKVPDTTLYATGWKGSLCGMPESCVFRYDGSAFLSWAPFDLIPPDNNNYVGTIFDYKGKTYLTGSVRDPVEPGYATFLRWTGTAWEHVPGWNTLSPIKEILIHNDTLYVGGAFRYETGGPGNLIARFDGENWNDLGGGLSYPPVPNGAVLDLEWWQGQLLASGRISQAGDADCTGIAKWDGHRWCSFAGVLQHASGIASRITDMAIWRDSLYICGDFSTSDGEPVRQLAQWIGGEATGECSTVGVLEADHRPLDLVVTPTPVDGAWMVRFPHPGPWQVATYNTAGQQVGAWYHAASPLLLDLSTQPPGMYLVQVSTPGDDVRHAKVVRP